MAKGIVKSKLSENVSLSNKPWRTVRVFVSSTFRDMQSERDYLAKVVFPELRDRMAKRNLHLVDLDLRWGVTEEEAEQGKVLEVILGEIDRSRPFFVGLLGERYGVLPNNIPEGTKHAYPWLKDYQGYSYTSLEIVHGVLRNPELTTHAFFYFRDPKLIQQIPETKLIDYAAENSQSASQLANLKNKIRSVSSHVMENYPCSWNEQNSKVADLEVFGQRVLEDLMTTICDKFPAEALDVDPVIVERQMHEAFVEERSYLHVGRVDQASRLTKLMEDKGRKPIVITGESGCGKSAFLANWYRQYSAEHPDDFILAYFVGASPDSTNHFRLLRNMCMELKQKFDLGEKVPVEDKKLSEVFEHMLTSITSTGSSSVWQRLSGKSRKQPLVKRVIVLLDALDQLSPLEGAHGLGWLLDYIPLNVRLVTSSLEGECLDVLKRRGDEEITLKPLNLEEKLQIIRALLGNWGRKLDDVQTAELLKHPETKNPLYLRAVMEELRLFGNFELLTQRIKDLAPSIIELFNQVLVRLEGDHGCEFVAEVFSLLGCSRYGLSEVELLDLLSHNSIERLPQALWARLMLSTKMYLVQRGELFGFFHRQFADAVRMRYSSKSVVHQKMAKYFEQSPVERKIDEYPFQLQQGGQVELLASALSDLDLFDYAWKHNYAYEWHSYWVSLKDCFQPDCCYRIAFEKKANNEGETHNLATLSNEIGSFLEQAALYIAAQFFFEQSLKIGKSVLGPIHQDIATGLNNLALTYDNQGEYDKAMTFYQKALRIYKIAFKPNQELVATCLNNMALLYDSLGKYDQAIPLFQRALKISEKVLGPNHREVADPLNNLALVYWRQGRYDEALPLYQRALKIRESTLEPNNPRIAQSLNNLAVLYDSQGGNDEALPLYQRALKIYETTLGPNHPDLAQSLSNLAGLYRDQGKYDQAIPLFQRALKIYETTLGPNHREVANPLNNLALLYKKQGRNDEALPLYQRALKIRETTLGPNHPDLAQSLSNLAGLYRDQGKYDQAIPLFQRALKIYETTSGPNHPDLARILYNVAEIYYAQGRFAEAIPSYQQALNIDESSLGLNHPETKIITEGLKHCKDKLQRN